MTKSQIKFVVESYAKYFGRAPGADEIDYYGLKDNGEAEKASKVLTNIIADADAEKGQIETADFVNNAFQNLFGRDATTKEMNKYSKVIDAGKNLPIQSIVKSATKTDKKVYDNKKAVALKYAELGGTEQLDLSKISKDNLIELNFLNTVTKAADLKAKVVYDLPENSGVPSAFDGKTFTLTEGVDAGKDFTGTAKNDLFIADNSVDDNATAADTLDGGKGEDTFKLYDSTAGSITSTILPTLKNIENVALYNLKAGDLDVKKWDTVKTLNVVNAGAGTNATKGFQLGEKVTTVNFEDIAFKQFVTFDKALTAATIGVNNVTAATAPTITVDSAGTGALKTLAINAYGKESTVTLAQTTTATIETLDINGRADLTLDFAAVGAAKIVTIDGSEAEGKLVLDLKNTTANTLKTVKTGTGDDELALNIAVASGTTIDLGAGNDKLVAGATAGSVVTSTTTVIDGGAGIDTLDAALVNAGNAGVFKSFETISLNAAAGTTLDLDLLTKSTITSIAKDADAADTLINVKKSQSLTVNNNAAGKATTLTFKASEIAGTADAYTINFGKETTGIVDAGTVTIDGIETVTVNSLGKTSAATDTNKITLVDANAKSLVITGDKDLTVNFATGFGKASANATDGLGVSTIDASASTAGITLGTGINNLKTAWSGLTIKGGAGKDTIDMTGLTLSNADSKIIVNAGAGDDIIVTTDVGGTLTGGAGKDTFDVKAALVVATKEKEADGVVKTTITDLTAGDKIIFKNQSTEVFNKTKLDVSGVSNLDAALNLALAGDGGTNGIINWFQYANNTYIVQDNTAAGTGITTAGDIVVKINGVVDLTNSTLGGTNGEELTIA